MLEEELKSIDELIMLKHFLETEEKYEGQEREVNAIKIVLNLITKLQKENEEKDKQIDLILNEQIQDGYLVNFNNLEEAREYYNKLAKEKEE